jgi:hypothetical protein
MERQAGYNIDRKTNSQARGVLSVLAFGFQFVLAVEPNYINEGQRAQQIESIVDDSDSTSHQYTQ